MKRILSVILVFSMMLSCTACTGTEIPPTESEVSSEMPASEQAAEDIVLTLALTGSPEIQDVIDEFNAADNGYRIEVKRYRENVGENGQSITYSSEEQQYADLEILQDIINTDEIDIICSESFSNGVYYEILKNKDAFADLYEFMAEDAVVNTSTLNQHILSLNETDGKLCSLPTFYGATTLIGETRYVGTKENWTVDAFISRWEQMPNNATIGGSRRSEDVYYDLLRNNLEAFVDYENAQVHFDSPDFKRILEFCGSFESNHGEKTAYDYEAPEFVFEFHLDGFMSADDAFHGEEPYTLVGFPSSDGEGAYFSARGVSYSISAKSPLEKRAGAWAFIRTFATYEYQMAHDIIPIDSNVPGMPAYDSERGFPINNRAFEEIAQGIIDGQYYGGTAEDKGAAYEVALPTQEDYQKIAAYLDSIDRWETKGHGPLWDIINEEVMYYFSGERSLDETVAVIQSRASIWISEQS